MKRRNFIVGLGATAAGGTAVFGSGAFSSVEAERTVAVKIADDTAAYLVLNPTSEYAILQEQGTFMLDLSPSNPTEAGGIGVNANAETVIKNVFEIENRGTQTVEPTFEGGTIDGIEITLSDPSDDLTVTIAPFEGYTASDLIMDPGEAVSYDVTVFAGEGATPESDIDETITVVAEAVE